MGKSLTLKIPLPVEDALRGAMKVPPPSGEKGEQKQQPKPKNRKTKARNGPKKSS